MCCLSVLSDSVISWTVDLPGSSVHGDSPGKTESMTIEPCESSQVIVNGTEFNRGRKCVIEEGNVSTNVLKATGNHVGK